MPFCENCGAKISEITKFCSECGTPNQNKYDKKGNMVSSFFSRGNKSNNNDETVINNSGNYGESISELPAEFIIDNRYRIEQRLGSGGFGTVYKAWDQHIKCWKALKIIHSEFYDEKEVIHDLTREAKLLMEIQAENIVRLWDIHLQGNLKYIDMEYIDDGDLLDLKLRYDNKKVPELKVIDLAKQISAGMMKIHQKKIIHKDLKPQNIMLTEDGTVKIMDFGISETFRSSVSRIKDTSRSGTPRYMSPEHILGEDVGREADIWSFGIIVYELLCGRQPFVADNRNDILLQIERRKFKPLENISDKTNGLLWKCLQKSYHDRFSNFVEIYEYLNNNDVINIESEMPEIEKNKPITEKNVQQPKIADNVLDAFNNVLENKKEESEKNKKQLEAIKRKTVSTPIINQPKTIETQEMSQKKIKEFWSLLDSNWRSIFARTLGVKEVKLTDIPEIMKIKEITYVKLKDLFVIPYLTQLEKLIFSIDTFFEFDLTPIKNNFSIEELTITDNINNNDIRNMDSLKNLVNIRSLNLTFLNINSLDFIRNMVNLENLTLWRNGLSSLKGLEICSNLKELIVKDNNITNLTPIMSLTKLGILTIPDGIDTFDFELNHPDCKIELSKR